MRSEFGENWALFLNERKVKQEMDTHKKDTDRHVVLSEEQMAQTLDCFYQTVAETAGYMETEDTLYDCRRILIAPNVRDAIIRYYETAFMGATREQICTLLVMSGPKVDAKLKENEVVIQSGFIGTKNNV